MKINQERLFGFNYTTDKKHTSNETEMCIYHERKSDWN